jgi:predicted GIY-YIG superfamily endonuclease
LAAVFTDVRVLRLYPRKLLSRRDWKFELIEAQNPKWRDLTPDIV